MDDAGQTPLQRATGRGQENMVDFLIKSGANVNAVHADQRSVLHLASKNGMILNQRFDSIKSCFNL